MNLVARPQELVSRAGLDIDVVITFLVGAVEHRRHASSIAFHLTSAVANIAGVM
jgi:hypothetical protein